jgi:hypothetical protein
MSLIIHNNNGPINYFKDSTVTIHQTEGHNNIVEDEKNGETEEVEFEEISIYFPYITQECIKKNMAEHVENHLNTACNASAKALWKCIHDYEMMDYLATKDVDTTGIYNAICKHFGPLAYSLRNFTKYRY